MSDILKKLDRRTNVSGWKDVLADYSHAQVP